MNRLHTNINKFIILMFVLFLTNGNNVFAEGKEHKKELGQETKNVQIKNKREKIRAFYTAPPVIPHEVSERNQKECVYCHSKVRQIEQRVTVKTPHPQFYNCQQCHVYGRVDKSIDVPSFWQGLKEPKKGTRAHELAPPTIPHRTFLRENCLSCHGSKNPNKELRTKHPERSNCVQCHVSMKETEFIVE